MVNGTFGIDFRRRSATRGINNDVYRGLKPTPNIASSLRDDPASGRIVSRSDAVNLGVGFSPREWV